MNPAECGGKASFVKFPSGSSTPSVTWAWPGCPFKGQSQLCGCKGLRGSATKACVDIWLEKSCPPQTTTISLQQLAALTSDPWRSLALETQTGEESVRRERWCLFFFVSADHRIIQRVTWRLRHELNATLKGFESVFQIPSEIWGLSWAPRPRSRFKVLHWSRWQMEKISYPVWLASRQHPLLFVVER